MKITAPAVIRGLLFAFALACLAGCNFHRTEQKLCGTWRFEDSEGVIECQVHDDHSFSWWELNKVNLSTPGVLVQVGDWRIAGEQLLVRFNTANFNQTRKQ